MSSQKKYSTSPELNQALKMLGDDWTLRIVGNLKNGELRFCGLERAIPDINPVTLTNRLKKLESLGVVTRKIETVDKLSVSYELTSKGKAILPIIKEIGSFAQKFL